MKRRARALERNEGKEIGTEKEKEQWWGERASEQGEGGREGERERERAREREK